MTRITSEILGTEQEKSARPDASEGQLVDLFARTISYLRVSLTDQCNLRCIYCMPRGISKKLPCRELLSYEELLRVIELAVRLGIRKVRLTGGEPLVRNKVVSFIERLTAIADLHDIRLTTNGVLLTKYADALFAAGIRKLNISLDTLKRERFRQITGVDYFDQVWEGIRLAQSMGFTPVKINMVVLRGINDDELLDFARLALTHGLQVRFIEFMPIGEATIWDREKYIASEEIRKRVAVLGELTEVQTTHLDGPARLYRFKQAGEDAAERAIGTIGFISPISHRFCDQCNRLRLTAEGRLRSCLLSDQETDLKQILRSGGTDEEVKKILLQATLDKPRRHTLLEKESGGCHSQMSRIGG